MDICIYKEREGERERERKKERAGVSASQNIETGNKKKDIIS